MTEYSDICFRYALCLSCTGAIFASGKTGDEYHFDLDAIEHDPYVLISILSAFNEGEFTLDEVQGLLQTLFDRQYILTEDVEVEVRYRTETLTEPPFDSAISER